MYGLYFSHQNTNITNYSVDHEYVVRTLERYGFGPKYIQHFKLLYKNISAKILINGHQSKSVSIERGFKQRDPASCGWFNICIDPLIRNIIADRDIKMIRMVTMRTHISSWYRPSVGRFSCTASTPVCIGIIYSYSNLNNPVTYFHWKFSPLPEIEPRTSPVPNWYATNWAILAWICGRKVTIWAG